jgi:hypothetical protein
MQAALSQRCSHLDFEIIAGTKRSTLEHLLHVGHIISIAAHDLPPSHSTHPGACRGRDAAKRQRGLR